MHKKKKKKNSSTKKKKKSKVILKKHDNSARANLGDELSGAVLRSLELLRGGVHLVLEREFVLLVVGDGGLARVIAHTQLLQHLFERGLLRLQCFHVLQEFKKNYYK